MGDQPLSRRVRVVSGTLDQIFSSASNGLITFAIAVVSTPQTFGDIALMMMALVAVMGTMRGAIGTPLLLKADQTSAQIRREGSFALVAGVVVGLILALFMLTYGRTVGLPAVLLAVSAPFVLCQDMLRYVAIAEGRPHVAALWDGIWCLGTVGLLVATWLDVVTVPYVLGGWGGLALAAFVGMAVSLRVVPRVRGIVTWAAAGWQHRVRYGIDAGIEQVTVFLVLTIVAAMLGSAATAALRGATVLLAPLAILASAFQLIVISESTRSSSQPRVVWQGIVRFALVMVYVNVVAGLLLWSLPVHLGAYLLGESFAPAQQVLPIVVVEYGAVMLSLGLGIFLKTFNRSTDAIVFKIGTMVATLVVSLGAAVLFPSATGVAVGLAVGTILGGTVGLAIIAPWQARARAESVDIAAAAPRV
ncbi:hypothetical protein [Mycolicibacterium sediminis]|uniref:Uncharacterized protein n=1 Tax=Mycolicibacterium sediminis TaxID=1286180 RepID=A0A7I7QRP5_9MYCO|nr:hypothetical protein [Mycolicibacterium sediminis]BBY28627.1 hypothetical protein MSEDJ_27230 [Mycolicibacterium sediminis]